MPQRLFQTLAVVVGLAVLAALLIPALAQDGPDYPEYSGSYALLVGVSEYDYHDFWKPLPNVPGYLNDIEQALMSKGFNITVVADPTNSELHQALTDFMVRYGRDFDNRLLIYFMGHGYRVLLNNEYVGYLVSKDAPPVNSPVGKHKFLQEAVPMTQLWNLAQSIRAKHALLMLDAAFSGHAIPNEEPGPPLSPGTEQVVQVIVAGYASQNVPAKSTFTESFLEAITTARADKDGDGLLTGSQLGDFLSWKVSRASHGHQTPYTIKLFGGGDFVFRVPRDNP